MTNKAYIKYYTEALYQLVSTDSGDNVATRFVGVLKKRGHLRLATSVLQSLDDKLRKEKEKNILYIEIANEWDDKKFMELIEKEVLYNNISYMEKVIKIVPEIVGGFRLRIGETFLDRSYRKKLFEIYKNITADVKVQQ